MDKVVKENIEKFLSNTSLFYSILSDHIKNGKDENEIIQLLKMQHGMNKSAMMDLGVKFDDTITIRSLNERVRELESQLGADSDISIEKVNLFINELNNQFNHHMKENGIYASIDISSSSQIKVHMNIFSQDINYKPSYCNDEEDKQRQIDNHNVLLEKFMTNFETISAKQHGSRQCLKFSERNIEKLNEVIYDFFKLYPDHFEYEIRPEETDMTISHYTFTLTTLDSHKNFARAMAER